MVNILGEIKEKGSVSKGSRVCTECHFFEGTFLLFIEVGMGKREQMGWRKGAKD